MNIVEKSENMFTKAINEKVIKYRNEWIRKSKFNQLIAKIYIKGCTQNDFG